jgi:ATP-dependent DNA helicase RecQ
MKVRLNRSPTGASTTVGYKARHPEQQTEQKTLRTTTRLPRPTTRQVANVVTKVFGLSSLRPGQQAVIDAVLAGRHTLAIMPTGAGKSLCYQVPAMLMPGTTVVISPLIALMKDQFEKMTALGITSVQVNSAVTAGEIRQARGKIGRRVVEFIFTTPEQLATSELRALLAHANVDLLVIDEAHCITQWGHDFRPAYLEALTAMRALNAPTVLALTATAPPEVEADITQQLGLGPLYVVNTGVLRPNLAYRVIPVASDIEKQRQLFNVVRGETGATIVYAGTIRHVEQLRDLLHQEGLDVVAYHGRMRATERARVQEVFMNGGCQIIVATNAFGMGIDRPDIRSVIHYDLPASLEVYYQESGRAGRDGLAAECVLLFQRRDRGLQRFFMAGRYPTRDDFTALVNVLRAAAASGMTATVESLGESLPGISAAKIRVMIAALRQAGFIRERRGRTFSAVLSDTPVDTLAAVYDERRQRDQSKLEQMVVYAQTALCRTAMLLAALGEPGLDHCGTCDNCRGTAARAEAVAEGAA